LIQKGLKFFSKFIDYPAAIAGALIMGLLVGFINRKFGIWPASTAAMKQAAYTFFLGGMLTKLLYIISGKIPGKHSSAIISALIVTIITVSLVYAVHSMKGTPLPLESTIPTAILAPFGFSFLAYRKQKQK
jgi:ABC-type enterochelin transport system permease subunit